MKHMRSRSVLAVAGLLLNGCAASSPSPGQDDVASGSFATVVNCGEQVRFDTAPARVVLLKSAAVPALHELGVLDRVVARAGAFPSEYYDEATQNELAGIPELTERVDAGGHLQISADVVVAQEPDLVLGEVENLSRSTLEKVGIPLIEEPTLCKTGAQQQPSFQGIYDQLEIYGKVFGREARAQEATEHLKQRVQTQKARVAGKPQRTAAVLYPTVGGGVTYAYGKYSMAEPQLEAAGFTNVFGDVDSRVIEVSNEELIAKDPDVIILLYSSGDSSVVENTLTSLPGADSLTAVENHQVMTQLMNFTEPATPLTVDGLEHIIDRFYPESSNTPTP